VLVFLGATAGGPGSCPSASLRWVKRGWGREGAKTRFSRGSLSSEPAAGASRPSPSPPGLLRAQSRETQLARPRGSGGARGGARAHARDTRAENVPGLGSAARQVSSAGLPVSGAGGTAPGRCPPGSGGGCLAGPSPLPPRRSPARRQSPPPSARARGGHRRRRGHAPPAPPPRAPAGAAAALGLCCLLLLPGPGRPCPAGCACSDPHTVDCRDRGCPACPTPSPLDVRKLLVAGNRIQRIPEDFFIFYGDLVYLDFRNNSLRSLEEGTFSGSAKLAFLDLSYNNLTQLGAGAFRSAGRLVRLSLANNRLAGVHEDAFETLESLQVLELNDNNLRSLSVATLAALPALRTLRLDGNPWLCDCDFAHLYTWIQENESKLPKGLEEIQCSLPMENRRVFLHELSEASFSECKFSLSLTDLFIIIFSGVAVSIAAIISSFFLATVVQCFQRCTPNKDTEDDDEDEDD
ncbi:LOW QUALITY PROTEIN: leucine-rich repeat-containing protein 38, partial [Sorex araneus]|uniref:LOW QUALITY PROTEIN: leucine-rich repeat-containing protein 38 n=1 Tax=Sorex araneus TaxID=42254 RepID=UPI002433E406